MTINIQYDLSRYKNFIDNKSKFFQNDIQKSFKQIGDKSLNSHKQRLQNTKLTYQGTPFANLSPAYALYKIGIFGHENIGILSGEMMRQLKYDINQSGSDTKLTLGTTAKNNGDNYPLKFQRGNSKQPARPFVGLSQEEILDYINIIKKDLNK